MKSLSEASGARFLVVILPWLYDLDDSYPFLEIHGTVQGFCAENGIPALDLFPAFRGREAAELWVHPTDQHPNAAAHRIIAEAVHDYLITTFPKTPAGG